MFRSVFVVLLMMLYYSGAGANGNPGVVQAAVVFILHRYRLSVR
jgi:hypothetical protein